MGQQTRCQFDPVSKGSVSLSRGAVINLLQFRNEIMFANKPKRCQLFGICLIPD
jgi:hypothetical protein